jgi:hypothetical protein
MIAMVEPEVSDFLVTPDFRFRFEHGEVMITIDFSETAWFRIIPTLDPDDYLNDPPEGLKEAIAAWLKRDFSYFAAGSGEIYLLKNNKVSVSFTPTADETVETEV